jgi:hypothetical protein
LDLRTPDSALAWPLGIALALGMFVLVQLGFVALALRHGDEVVESYRVERR